MLTEDVLQTVLQQMFIMASLSMDTYPEMSSPFVSRLIDSCLLIRQTRPHSDAAAVCLSKVAKVIQSGLCL